MRAFSWQRMGSVDETVAALAENGEDAALLAGGQTLLNQMKLRIVSPAKVLWIGAVPELGSWRYDSDGSLLVGATVTYEQMQGATGLRGAHGMIAKVTCNIADQSVRNMATVGGAFCTADPHQDYPVLGGILEAELLVRSRSATRTIPALEFFVDYYETSLAPDELLTAVRFRPLPDRTGWAFEKFNFRPGDYARAIVACRILLGRDGRVEQARLVIGATEPVPVHARETEAMLIGQRVTEDLAQKIAKSAMAATEPMADQVFASPEYKRELVGTLAYRAVMRAHQQAGKNS